MMLEPTEMTQVRIITPSNKVRSVIETLYDMKILHIIDFQKDEKSFFDIGKPFSEASIYSQQLIDARAMISRLNITGQSSHLKNFKQAQKIFSELEEKFKSTVIELDKLNAEAGSLMQELENPLNALDITKEEIKEYKSLASFSGTVKSSIKSKLGGITDDYMLKEANVGKKTVMLLYVRKALSEKVRTLLSDVGFTEYQPVAARRSDIENSLSKARSKLAGLEKQLDDIKKTHSQFLIDFENAVTELNEKTEVPLKFAASRNTVIASGWVPAKTAEKLKAALDEVANGKVSVEMIEGKNPPTYLKNPSLVKPFELFLDMYSLPRYREIDPTFLMFMMFPLFFGFMLGDVGYGIVTLVLTFVLGRVLPASLKPIFQVITLSALATIAFGFVFGEVFGYEFVEHPLLNRVHDINTMILISIAVGVLHINFGFMLGLLNELKHHSFITAFFRKGAWITLQAGAGILAYGFVQSNQVLQIGGAVLSAASILMVIKGEGFLKIVELPALLSNTLSYIRLYAIGLASVSLAAVVNSLAAEAFVAGGFSMIFGVGILFAGHTINLLLGLLGPFLHSLRLHYVEFFQKFYEGGGYQYSPFGFIKTLGGR